MLGSGVADPADGGLAAQAHAAHGVHGEVDVGGAQLDGEQLDRLEDVA